MIQKAPSFIVSAVCSLRLLTYAAAITATLFASQTMVQPVAAAGDCTVSATDAAADSEEQAMLTAINAYRQQNGLTALVASDTLNRSAAWLSKDMATRRTLNRTDSLGRDHLTRMKDCGATFTTADEAVAVGGADVAATLQMWRASTAQNMAILTPAFKSAGIARAVSTATPPQTFWTLELSDAVDSGSGSTTTGAGGTAQAMTTSAQSGMGTVSVTVSLSNATSQTAAARLSGFQFVLSGSMGGVYATPPTNEQGQTSLSVPAGTYTVTQQPKAGAALVSISGGTSAGNAAGGSTTTSSGATSGTVTVAPGMTAAVTVVERVDGAGLTTTSTNPTTATNPTTNPLTNPLLNPAANPFSNPLVNNPLASPFINPGTNPLLNPASSTVPAVPGAATTTTSAATTNTATESVTLVAGCNNVSITWAAGTPISTVATAVSGTLDAIWRWDGARNMYLGYSARPGAPSDYTMVGEKFEAAFICVNAAGSITRPAA